MSAALAAASIIPPERPKWPRDVVVRALRGAGIFGPAILGVRGYYLDTMGKPGENDRGFYDDAFFWWSPNTFVAFNGNTDPSRYKPRIATLCPGTYRYKEGTHGISRPVAEQRPGLVQASPVTITRDGGEKSEYGWFGINFHDGALGVTGSAGCQTLPPAQWQELLALYRRETRRVGVDQIYYHLIDYKAWREGQARLAAVRVA